MPGDVPDLQSELETAIESSRYMVAIWRLDGGQLKMYRMTKDFPTADFEGAINLLQRDLGAGGSSQKNPSAASE